MSKLSKQMRRAPVPTAPVAQRRPMKITTLPGDDHQWRAPQPQSRRDIFKPASAPPGVIAADQMAMDNASDGSVTSWAAQGQYGEGLGFLGYAYLSELSQRPEYRRMVETIAKEMTRKWVKLRSTGNGDKTDRITKLNEAMSRYRLQDVFRRVAEHDGFFGRGHLFIDTGAAQDTLTTRLTARATQVGKGALRGFRTVEPIWTYPNDYNSNDPLAEDFYRPRSWYVMGNPVHGTRLLTFVSREVPDVLKPAYAFGGVPLTQMALPYVQNWLRTRQSVSDIIHSFTVFLLKTNMGENLSPEGMSDLVNRAVLFNRTRDNRGLLMVDKETEDFANVSAPLAGLHELQAQSQEQMASVSGIPIVKLLGNTPSGLNASSDGEIRVFYDWIHSQQEHLFRHHLQTCLEMIQLSEWGEIDPEITFEFVSLWQLDEAMQATVEKTKADTHAVYLDAGVIDAQDVRTALAGDEASPYQGLDISGEEPADPLDDLGEHGA